MQHLKSSVVVVAAVAVAALWAGACSGSDNVADSAGTPECTGDADCRDGQSCVNGACVEAAATVDDGDGGCQSDADCGPTEKCDRPSVELPGHCVDSDPFGGLGGGINPPPATDTTVSDDDAATGTDQSDDDDDTGDDVPEPECANNLRCIPDKICQEGRCVPPGLCTPDSAKEFCPHAWYCDAKTSQCVRENPIECLSDADCTDPALPVCNLETNKCDPPPPECVSDDDCDPIGTDRVCNLNNNKCRAANTCRTNGCPGGYSCDVFNAKCVYGGCVGNSDCPGETPSCRVDGLCVECQTAADCPTAGDICRNYECRETTASDPCFLCDTETQTCVNGVCNDVGGAAGDGQPCQNDQSCKGGYVCTTFSGSICREQCNSPDDQCSKPDYKCKVNSDGRFICIPKDGNSPCDLLPIPGLCP